MRTYNSRGPQHRRSGSGGGGSGSGGGGGGGECSIDGLPPDSSAFSDATFSMADWHSMIRLQPGAPVRVHGFRGIIRRANPLREASAVFLPDEQRTIEVPFRSEALREDRTLTRTASQALAPGHNHHQPPTIVTFHHHTHASHASSGPKRSVQT